MEFCVCWERLWIWPLTFSSFPHPLIIFFCWLFRLKRNEWRKWDLDTFKFNFYSQDYNYFVVRNVFSRTSKIAALPVKVTMKSEEFLFDARKPIFRAYVHCPPRQSPPWRLLFFCIFLYFLCALFLFFPLLDFYLLSIPSKYRDISKIF